MAAQPRGDPVRLPRGRGRAGLRGPGDRPGDRGGRTGVVTAFDRERLVAEATAGGVVVELTRGVGEFVGRGQELLCVQGDGAVDDAALLAAVRVADERTIEQDPAFALRIIVDTAIRALSPAVNDPTTAVHALDSVRSSCVSSRDATSRRR